MAAVHNFDFVPGAVLACVELASQLGLAAEVTGFLLQASCCLQMQLVGLRN